MNRGQQTDWELEDWLLDAGECAELKAAAGEPLTPAERLIREFWAFDIHTRNGGVSQYFCNCELLRWRELKAAWLPEAVPSLGQIVAEVDRILGGASDPYQATLDASPSLEDFYEAHQLDVRRELRRLAAET